MSEAELHFIRARLRGGQLSKARRGELPLLLPIGLVYDPSGKVVLDPDAGVQQAVRHLFATFSRTGSARATVQMPAGVADAAQPSLRGCIRLWATPGAQERGGQAEHREGATRGLDRPDPRRPPRLHHLGTVRTQSRGPGRKRRRTRA